MPELLVTQDGKVMEEVHYLPAASVEGDDWDDLRELESIVKKSQAMRKENKKKEAYAHYYELIRGLLKKVNLRREIAVIALLELVALEDLRPADLFQRWFKLLREAAYQFSEDSLEYMLLMGKANDLFLDQSLPFGEAMVRDTLYEGHEELDQAPYREKSTLPVNSFDQRLIEEYTGKEIEISAVLKANAEWVGDQGEEEPVWYEEGVMPSTAIRQSSEQDFSPNMEELTAIRRDLKEDGLLRAIKSYAKRRLNAKKHLLEGEELNKAVHKEVFNQYFGRARLALMDLSREYQVQNLYLAFVPITAWLGEGIFKGIAAYVNIDGIRFNIGSMYYWAKVWGDAILEEALAIEIIEADDPFQTLQNKFFGKKLLWPSDQDKIAAIAKFDQNTRKKLLNMTTEDRSEAPKKTRAYNEAYMRAVDAGDPRPDLAAMRAWREWLSPRALRSYETSIAAGDPYKQAHACFHSCGQIISWNETGLLVVTDTKETETRVDWKYLKYRLSRKNLYVPNDFPKKKELFMELSKRRIPKELMETLKEDA